jgi:PAS domain S-box-containing protein
MRLQTETHTAERPDKKEDSHIPSHPPTQHETPHTQNTENPPLESTDCIAIAARATGDAVRDWNIATGEFSWPIGLENLLGYAPNESSQSLGFWQKNVHQEDRAHIAASIRDALAGETERWTGEYRFRRADGEFAQILERAIILRDSRGQALRFVGSLMDVTQRKQLQEQVIRSQKLDAFGQLAGGVAHDFNNFLTTILGYSDLLLQESAVRGNIASHIGEIRDAAGRASALTSQLLAFSRKQPLEPRVLEVNTIVANLERSLLRLLGENIRVTCHLHELKGGAHIKVDPGQMTQILLNLAVNARDAMPSGGRLTIQTSTVSATANSEPDCGPGELPAGEYVVVTVEDTGAGLSDEAKAHLFEPFFTTKTETHSGLGLATSYGIIRQSGGYICVDSAPGHGTTVNIFLPRVPAPPAPGYKKPGSKKMPTGTETILVLEDDVSVRHISVRVLRNLGYQVIEAANGDDAQRLIADRGGKHVDLLLTDMVMPQMSGRHFANWLRTTSPATRVVFASGYLDESLHPGDRRDPEMFFLPKPFDPEQLARKVREALDLKR